jgi:hypothetical protein
MRLPRTHSIWVRTGGSIRRGWDARNGGACLGVRSGAFARRSRAWSLAWLPLLLSPAGAGAQTDSQVVETFFPQRLIDESRRDYQRGGPLPFRTSAFVVADLDNDGSPFIVAAYTNGFSGVVRVLERVDGTARLVHEPDLPALGGVFPSLRLLDFDHDGRAEVVVSCTSARGPTADWVFRWDGSRLALLGPTTRDALGVADTPLSNADFVDIDGDGILEVLNPTGADSGPGAWEVYRLEERTYVAGAFLHYVATFFPPPAAGTQSFVVANPGPAFLLTVINGDRDGGNRVRAGTIRLNGRDVVGPADLDEGMRTVVRRVPGSVENVVAVTLVGTQGSRVLVTVGPAPP